jgi:hypothetical protein
MTARISLTLGKARGHSYGCALSRLRSAAMAARCRACAPRTGAYSSHVLAKENGFHLQHRPR